MPQCLFWVLLILVRSLPSYPVWLTFRENWVNKTVSHWKVAYTLRYSEKASLGSWHLYQGMVMTKLTTCKCRSHKEQWYTSASRGKLQWQEFFVQLIFEQQEMETTYFGMCTVRGRSNLKGRLFSFMKQPYKGDLI